MPRPLRGYHIDLPVPGDPAGLQGDLSRLGYAANAYLEEVVRMVFVFIKEEEERLVSSLHKGPVASDLVVGRHYRDIRDGNVWILIRRDADHWRLSALLSEAS